MEYRTPRSLEEAIELLGRTGFAKPVAGGTDLAVLVAEGLVAPDTLVDLCGIPGLRGIRRTPEGITIGAATTMAEIAVRDDLPACLVQGARAIGSSQIRNLATIGGNICNASPCGDTLAPLLVLEADFVLASAAGSRTVAANGFFLGPKKTVVSPHEILVEVRIPRERLEGSSAFRMIGKRNGQAISQVNAAVWILRNGDRIRVAHVAVGSVAPVPLRLTKTEALLQGATAASIDMDSIRRCIDSEIAPISDVRASVEYRRLVAGHLLVDALEEALEG
jgi:CO/xanthine dehydrogenase FAD-binding subunit